MGPGGGLPIHIWVKPWANALVIRLLYVFKYSIKVLGMGYRYGANGTQ